MTIRLGDLVGRLGGRLEGDPGIAVSGIAPLEHAGERHITFLSSPKWRDKAAATGAAALILSPADDAIVGAAYCGARIVADNPYAYFARTAQWFESLEAQPAPPGVHPSAVVDASAHVAPGASIGPLAVVEADAEVADGAVVGAGCFVGRDARIGADSVLHPRVVVQARCIVGDRCILHSGAVIGAAGFGFANEKGAWIRIPQTGRVVIGNDVDIGANTTVDRGALDDTVIEDGVKLDNLIQIGHNVRVGKNTAMAGCVGVAGSATIGANCTFGGGAIVLGHLTVADGVHVSAATVVTRSIHKAGQYTGMFPIDDNASWEKNAATLKQLHSLRERLKALEKAPSKK